MKTVAIDGALIKDSGSFHAEFRRALGFPDFYGENMDAWIDCMSSIDDPDAGMTSVILRPGETLSLRVLAAEGLAERCPKQLNELISCTAFVNQRFRASGEQTTLLIEPL